MSQSRVFLHIGMPRTATTFFQNKLFPLIDEFDYHQLPETHFDRDFQRLLYQDESLYLADDVEGGLREKVKGECTLFSNENFIGQSLFMSHGNRSRTAARLRSTFPEAEVILFLRAQVDLLKSLYAIDVAGELSCSVDDFIVEDQGGYRSSGSDWHDYAVYNTLEAREHLEGYRYKELLDLYHSHFSKVHVFLFEDFRSDPAGIARRLVDIIGRPWTVEMDHLFSTEGRVNASVGARAAKRLSRLNAWYPLIKGAGVLESVYYRLKRRMLESNDRRKIDLDPAKEERLHHYFSSANRELMAAYPDLGIERFSEKYCLE